MRRKATAKWALAVLAGALCAGAAPAAWASLEHADPIPRPAGPEPRPEDGAGRPAAERLQFAARDLGERGYRELPYVAWALIESARRSGDPALAVRAVELAPATPAVLFAASRSAKRPELAVRGLVALLESFPALLWLVVAGGAVLGAAVLGCAALLQGFAAWRGLPLAGHALGHVGRAHQPATWPGVLVWLGALALLGGLGAGPAVLLALAGCAGALRLRLAESVTVGIGLALAGLVLGPGLDLWTRAAASLERDGALASAWRVERGHPLPGDEAGLEQALARRPGDPLFQVALATARARRGDHEGATILLTSSTAQGEGPVLRAVEFGLLGAIELTRGEAGRAVEAYERARSAHESAPVLFNLSQAYGRALRLAEQAPAYGAARALDADAIERFTQAAGGDPSRLLMPVNVPASLYLSRALAPSPTAVRLARELRARMLGRRVPEHAWMALPLLGLIAAGLRRGSIARCRRCERTLCAHCSPENRDAATCLRCVRLFEQRQNVDPRVRQEQLQLDRRRQRRLALRTAGLALLVPGAGALRRGRCLRGVLQLGIATLGGALLISPAWIAAPWDVGPFGGWVALVGGSSLLAIAYLAALRQALRLARGGEVRA